MFTLFGCCHTCIEHSNEDLDVDTFEWMKMYLDTDLDLETAKVSEYFLFANLILVFYLLSRIGSNT